MTDHVPIYQNPNLQGYTIEITGSSTGFLLIHGFTATTTEVKQFANYLGSKGFTVYAPLLPGHGTNPQDLNRKNMTDWIGCVENSYQYLQAKCRRIIVGGESMGAVLSLYLAQIHPEIKALLLYSPAIKVQRMRFAGLMKWIKPILEKKNYDPGDMQWQGYTVYPVKAAHEFYKLQRLVKRNLSLVNHPALILQGIYDRTIDDDSGKFIYESIRSQQKEFYWMKDSGHVMLLGEEFTRIGQLTSKFLESVNIQ